MSIALLESDPRAYNEPEAFEFNHGSFSSFIININKELKKLKLYSEPDYADWVVGVDGLNVGFKYNDNSKNALLNFWELSTLPAFFPNAAYSANQKFLFASNQTKKLWNKIGFDGDIIGAGVDGDFWKPVYEKNKDKLQFLFVNSSNIRSCLDLTLEAFYLAFKGNRDIKLIIKDTNNNEVLINNINNYKNKGLDIEYRNNRCDMRELRKLYSESHICLNVQRAASLGLCNLEAMACNTFCITADFEPLNEVVNRDVGLLIPVKDQISLNAYAPIAENFGLLNTYKNIRFLEEPTMADFDLDIFTEKLYNLYLNWSKYSLIKPREYVINKYKWEDVTKKLVKALDYGT